jgi:hypothetical protein
MLHDEATRTSFNHNSFTPPYISNQQPEATNTVVSNASDACIPSFVEAEALIDLFRYQILPHFPFITLQQVGSAQQLYQEKPLLYIAILAISSRSSSQQKQLGQLVMKQLAERMFLNGERNLDLLLGVLTYAAWFV